MFKPTCFRQLNRTLFKQINIMQHLIWVNKWNVLKLYKKSNKTNIWPVPLTVKKILYRNLRDFYKTEVSFWKCQQARKD